MKTGSKMTIAIMAITVGLTAVSCKKSFSCSCKTTVSTTGYSSSSETSEVYSLKLKEKQAKAACDNTKAILEKQAKDLNQGYNVSTSCELKK